MTIAESDFIASAGTVCHQTTEKHTCITAMLRVLQQPRSGQSSFATVSRMKISRDSRERKFAFFDRQKDPWYLWEIAKNRLVTSQHLAVVSFYHDDMVKYEVK